MIRASATVALCAALCGCFTTRVGVENSADPGFERRQWFTVGGLVPLSDSAGGECTGEVSYSESRMGGWDVLINIGLSLVGGAVAVGVCDLPDNPTSEEVRIYSTCTGLVSASVPFLLGSRTVRYQCASPAAPVALVPKPR